MPCVRNKSPAGKSSQPSVASLNTSQAFVGLHLHENLEIADGLEFFVRGYIECAKNEGLKYVPLSCAEQALKAFAHHDSWGQEDFPWDRLDRNWKNAAMNKLVYHVRDGHRLAEKPIDEFSLLDTNQAAVGGGRACPSIEGEEDGEPDTRSGVGSVSIDKDEEDGEADEDDEAVPGPPIAPVVLLKRKATPSRTGRIALPASRRRPLPYELAFSSPDSLSKLAALKRARNNSSPILAPSLSPLSTLPSSMFKSLLAVRTNTDRRQTRSITRAASSRRGSPSSTISKASSRQSVRLQEKKTQEQTTATGEALWPFDAILDSRVKDEDVEYKIKWAKGEPTWQPSLDLRDPLEEIGAFHRKYPEKEGPPVWFAREVAKAQVEERSG